MNAVCEPEPAWLVAALDQKVALIQEQMSPFDLPAPIVLTHLSEPEDTGISAAEWERTCDNCGAYCPPGAGFYLGQAVRYLGSTQVLISYGSCPTCVGRHR